jgi:hypothetical protein
MPAFPRLEYDIFKKQDTTLATDSPMASDSASEYVDSDHDSSLGDTSLGLETPSGGSDSVEDQQSIDIVNSAEKHSVADSRASESG